METFISLAVISVIVLAIIYKRKPQWWNKLKSLFKE